MSHRHEVPLPTPEVEYGFVWPDDGAWVRSTTFALSTGVDPETKARAMAKSVGGRAIRIVTTLEWLDP